MARRVPMSARAPESGLLRTSRTDAWKGRLLFVFVCLFFLNKLRGVRSRSMIHLRRRRRVYHALRVHNAPRKYAAIRATTRHRRVWPVLRPYVAEVPPSTGAWL